MENSAKSLTSDYYVDPSNYQMEDWSTFYDSYTQKLMDEGKIGARVAGQPDSFVESIFNWFNGGRDMAWAEYQRQQEIKDRAYSQALDATKYGRAFEDIKRAGYNPWLMLQSNLGAATVAPGAGSTRNSGKYISTRSGDQTNDVSNLLTSAMKIVALLAMTA